MDTQRSYARVDLCMPLCRTQERLHKLGFPTLSQVQLSAEDFEEDPMEACQTWQAAIEAQVEARAQEAEEAQLAQLREPRRVTRSPFSTKGSVPFPCHTACDCAELLRGCF